MSPPRGLLTPEERARIRELQDALFIRFVERSEAVSQGRNDRAKVLQAEIDDLQCEKEEIEKWATVGSA
jgi:hypothetical protein